MDSALAAVVAAYRTCEFATLSRDGTPMAWPTIPLLRPDGTLQVTTSVAFPQKALNVRRDGRVAMLFSDPTGSGLQDPPQVLVRGVATSPDEVLTSPEGLEPYWRELFRRQPGNRGHLRPPMRWLMDWYYLRLVITVEPTEVTTLPALRPGPGSPVPADLLGAGYLARQPTAVLAAPGQDGAPVLFRVHAVADAGGFAVTVPDVLPVRDGAASLLVHEHDEQIAGQRNAVVRGRLVTRTGGGRVVVPERVVDPMPMRTPADMLTVIRHSRAASHRYLDRRGLGRPRVRWDRFRALAG